MYHRDVIARIARRLPHRTQRDVVEVLIEVWSEELVAGRSIIVPDIGWLSIEVQNVKADGAISQHGWLRRVYGRFRLTESLKEHLQEVELE